MLAVLMSVVGCPKNQHPIPLGTFRHGLKGLRLDIGNIAEQAIGGALGTLLAGLILVLGAVAVGAISDISTDALISVVAAIAGIVASLVAALVARRAAREAERKRMAALSDSDRLAEILDQLRELGVVHDDPPPPSGPTAGEGSE